MTDTPCRNFMYAMLNAVNTDQATLQWMQITDSQTTINNAKLQTDYYTAWNAILATDAQNIKTAVDNGADQGTISALQTQYQKDSTMAQTQQSTCDSATQASQQTVGQDGSNLQNKASLASTLSSISQAMASMLAHAY